MPLMSARPRPSALPRVYNANQIRDVVLPPQTTAAQVVGEVDAFFAGHGVSCWKWVIILSAPAAQTKPITDHLHAAGYRPQLADVMLLRQRPSGLDREVGG